MTVTFVFSGREAHISRPPPCLHDQHCYDAINGERDLIIHIYFFVLSSVTLGFFFANQQIGVTFAIVFGVILYRISTKAALHMSSNPVTRSHVQLTVKTTAAIINLVVILILDEVYGAVARWLTVLGKFFMEAWIDVNATLQGGEMSIKVLERNVSFLEASLRTLFLSFYRYTK